MIAYCKPFARSNLEDHRLICQEFVDTANQLTPHVMKKCKIHLLIHLPHNMQDFGPTSAYNTERYDHVLTLTLVCSQHAKLQM